MNSEKIKIFFFFLIGGLIGILLMFAYTQYQSEPKETATALSAKPIENSEPSISHAAIDQLTKDSTVINYVKKHHQLPDYYLTKAEARTQGWIPEKGNLCDVLPRKAIGGDRFGNREKKLPAGKIYYEADVNYRCGKRNADRIVYTDSGEIWLTKDHYKSFDKQ